MKIGGIKPGGEAGFSGGQLQMGADSVSKNLQKQIANVQKSLQELSSNQEMSIEEKVKRRQELQQQISDLNQQLRQRQIDLRREKQEAAKEAAAQSQENLQKEEADEKETGLSKAYMRAMVSADSAVGQAEVYGKVSRTLKGEARTLQSDIAQDKKRGIDAAEKENALAKIEKRMEKAVSSQIGTLGKAGRELRVTTEKEREEIRKTKEKDSKEVSETRKKEIENFHVVTGRGG